MGVGVSVCVSYCDVIHILHHARHDLLINIV